MHTQSLLAILAVTGGLLGACTSDPTGTGTSGAGDRLTLSVAPSSVTINSGRSLRLTAIVHHGDGSTSAPGGVAWESSDATIATVAAGGLVQGVQAGRTQIRALWRGSRASSLVTVMPAPAAKPEPATCLPRISVTAGGTVRKRPGCE